MEHQRNNYKKLIPVMTVKTNIHQVSLSASALPSGKIKMAATCVSSGQRHGQVFNSTRLLWCLQCFTTLLVFHQHSDSSVPRWA